MIIDVHAHLHLIKSDKIEEVIKRSEENKVISIITNGLNLESNKKSLELSKKFSIVKPALGLYPTEIPKNNQEIEENIEFIKKNKPFAIGEIGLDFKEIENHKNKLIEIKKQKETFQKLLELAEKIKKPVILHTRKAEKEVIEQLETTKIKNNKIILHCFSGNFKLVKKIIDNDWNFSIPTNIVRSEHFQKITKETPTRQLFTETDTPYLSPFKTNQKKIDENSIYDINEPSNIKLSIKKIAEIKRMEEEEIKKNIFMNYQRTFL